MVSDSPSTSYRHRTTSAVAGHESRKFAARIEEKTMAEWTAIFDGTDACVAPVRRFDDALHRRAQQRARFVRTRRRHRATGAGASFSRTTAAIAAARIPRAPAPIPPSRRGVSRWTRSTRCVRVVPSVEAASLDGCASPFATVLGDAAGWSSRRSAG
jgi:hypothetical protein